jgi:hypothetical protein
MAMKEIKVQRFSMTSSKNLSPDQRDRPDALLASLAGEGLDEASLA